jgi:hypothetical protein
MTDQVVRHRTEGGLDDWARWRMGKMAHDALAGLSAITLGVHACPSC